MASTNFDGMASTQPRAEQLDAFVRSAQSVIGVGGAYFTAEQRCMVANEAASCLGCALCAGLDAECTSADSCAPIVKDLAKALEKALAGVKSPIADRSLTDDQYPWLLKPAPVHVVAVRAAGEPHDAHTFKSPPLLEATA